MNQTEEIQVTVNGKPQVFGERIAISRLLDLLEFEAARVAVAVNREFVSRRHYDDYVVQTGDKIDIVAPMAGG